MRNLKIFIGAVVFSQITITGSAFAQSSGQGVTADPESVVEQTNKKYLDDLRNLVEARGSCVYAIGTGGACADNVTSSWCDSKIGGQFSSSLTCSDIGF